MTARSRERAIARGHGVGWLSCLLVMAARPVAAQAADDEKPGVPPCDLWAAGSELDDCNTPRNGTLSGMYLGLDFGSASMKAGPEARAGANATTVLQLRLGFELWDYVVLGTSLGHYFVSDLRPWSEDVAVTECTYVQSVQVGCSEPMAGVAESEINTGMFLGVEAGPQYRFRPWRTTSWTLGVLVGYLDTFTAIDRGVPQCEGCRVEAVDLESDGAFVSPFVRVTFGETGWWALLIRSQWFVDADLEQFTTGGVEVGLP